MNIFWPLSIINQNYFGSGWDLGAFVYNTDTTAPITADNIDSSTGNVVVTLTCNDGSGNGCANTYYTTDGSTPTTSSTSGNGFTLAAHQNYTISFFSVDNAGNQESIKTDSISAVFSSASSNSGSAFVCDSAVTAGTPDLFEIRTTKSTATLYFAPPVMPYSNFYIAFSRNPNTWEYGTQYNQGYSGGVLQYTVNLLQPNTKYYFRVRSGNGCATGSWGNTMTANTTSSKNFTTFYKNFVSNFILKTKTSLTSGSSISVPKTKTTVPTPLPVPTQPTTQFQTLPQTQTQPEATPAPKSKFCFLWWCY